MRPKLLEIEGLQSFHDVQKIDFEALGETGLFGIFGPTGSGKSTILDAITFALYGKVKRAERGTQGIINTNRNTVKVSFTFELLKGSRKTYRIERIYQRRKGSDNSCEPKVARLIEVTEVGEIPVCDKASEVSSSIEELLGLGHDDFTRAVVLPQNSFQEFLLLDNAKKREMLERIFYLEEYGKQLLEKLNRRMTRLKSRIDVLSGELKGYADASDEALEEARKAMESAVSERTRAEKELKLLEVKYNEAKEVWQLVQELALVNQREEEHMASREAVNVKRTQLEKAVKADGLLEMIQKSKELSAKLLETEKQLKDILDKLPVVTSSLNETRQKYEGIKNEARTEQPKLIGLRTRLSDALGIEAEIEVIRGRINELQESAAKLKGEIFNKGAAVGKETRELEVLEQSLGKLGLEMEALKIDPEYRQQIQDGAKLENEVGNLSANIDELKIKVEGINGIVAGLEQKLDKIKEEMLLSQKALDALNIEKQNHEASMLEDRDSVLKYREELHALQTVYDVLKLRNSELDGMNSRITMQRSILVDLTEKALITEEVKTKAGEHYEHCRMELERASREMDRYTAYVLSKSLRDGEPCPVCGSESHPKPAAKAEGMEPAVFEQQVENAGKRLAEVEKSLKEAEGAHLIAREQVKGLTGQIDQMSQELEQKIIEYNEVVFRLPEELRSMKPEQIRAELDRMSRISLEKLKTIDVWGKRQEEYKAEIQKLSEQLSEQKLVENGIISELKVNRKNREHSEEALAAASAIYQKKQKEYMEFLQYHNIDRAAAELKRFAENDRKMSLLQKQMEQIREMLGKKRTFLEQLKEEAQILNSEKIRVETENSNLVKQKTEKEIKLRELAGKSKVELNSHHLSRVELNSHHLPKVELISHHLSIKDEIRRIDEKLDEYSKLEKQYQENLKVLEIRNSELTTQKSLLDNQKNIYTENLESEKGRLTYALLEKGFEDSGEVERSIIPKEKQRALNDEINEYEQAERNIQAQKFMAVKKLNSRSITEQEWDSVSSTYRQMAAFKEECVSRSEVARNSYNTLKNKHDRWAELNKNYSELINKFSLFEQIQKLLRAERGKDNSFIDYIAEERLRYVAAKASETLGLMTKYRYVLELDIDAGFIIRDNANGGVHRMVTSLSGGETFLTSLALALALSEQIQLKGQSPLEFFFLDEGFGTLDTSLLDTVIDSLERLSRKERVIGLISHVPELRSRIGRRLIVDPPSTDGNGSRVRIEKA